eukprot:Opistho-2@52715
MANQGKKRRQQTFTLAAFLEDQLNAVKDGKSTSAPVKTVVGLNPSIVSRDARAATAAQKPASQTIGKDAPGKQKHAVNSMDSSAPTRPRGKEREKPKKKKPTLMKKIITAERDVRKAASAARREVDAHAAAQPSGASGAAAGDVDGTAVTVNVDDDAASVIGSPSTLQVDAGHVTAGGSTDIIIDQAESANGVPIVDDVRRDASHGSPDTHSVTRIVTPPAATALALVPASHVAAAVKESAGDVAATSDAKEDCDDADIASADPAVVIAFAPPPIFIAIPGIHTKKFRAYCNQMTSPPLDDLTAAFLRLLLKFQERQKAMDPIKAKAKRRIVVGLREVAKHLKRNKLKCVIVAPDVEEVRSDGGLDDTLLGIIGHCRTACEDDKKGAQLIFSMHRRRLGRVLDVSTPVSIVGVFNYDGAHDQFKEMLVLAEKGRRDYDDAVVRAKTQMRDVTPTKTTVSAQKGGVLVETAP